MHRRTKHLRRCEEPGAMKSMKVDKAAEKNIPEFELINNPCLDRSVFKNFTYSGDLKPGPVFRRQRPPPYRPEPADPKCPYKFPGVNG